MCIILKPAHVTGTQILVSPNVGNSRQIIIYGNKVKTQHSNNAMILPVPFPETVRLHDISKYDKLFEDCDQSFKSNDMDDSYSYSNNSQNLSRGLLQVFKCGSYDISIVPSYDDFDRLSQAHFNVESKVVANILKKHYPTFGFIVCRLRKDKDEKYHPIAYSHQIYKPNIMFIPTRHHHDAEEETHSDYDHQIYSINTKSLCGNHKWNYGFDVQTEKIPNFAFPTINTFNKLVINQKTKNTDMYFYLETYMSPYSYGVDGCIFKSNNSAITFVNKGSIYITPLFRGLPFYFKQPSKNAHVYGGNYSDNPNAISFAGTCTAFIVDGNKVTVVDDIGTPEEHTLEFKFEVQSKPNQPGVYCISGWPINNPISVPVTSKPIMTSKRYVPDEKHLWGPKDKASIEHFKAHSKELYR